MADTIVDFVPLFLVVVGALVVWLAARWLIRREARRDPTVNVELRTQVATLAIALASLVAAIVAAPT